VGEPLAADEHRRLGVAAVVDVERISDICLSLHHLSSDFLVCPVKFADSLPDPLVNIIGGALNLIRRHYPDAVHASLVIDRGDRDGLPPRRHPRVHRRAVRPRPAVPALRDGLRGREGVPGRAGRRRRAGVRVPARRVRGPGRRPPGVTAVARLFELRRLRHDGHWD